MPEQPPKPPVQLNYATPPAPGTGPAGNVPYIAQMAIGFAAFLLIGIISVVITVSMNSPAPGLILAPLLLTVLCVIARVRWRWRGFLAGVLIALGLLLLAAGICAVMLANMNFH